MLLEIDPANQPTISPNSQSIFLSAHTRIHPRKQTSSLPDLPNRLRPRTISLTCFQVSRTSSLSFFTKKPGSGHTGYLPKTKTSQIIVHNKQACPTDDDNYLAPSHHLLADLWHAQHFAQLLRQQDSRIYRLQIQQIGRIQSVQDLPGDR